MRLTVNVGDDFRRLVAQEMDGAAERVTRAMATASRGLLDDLRSSVRGAGLGNLWRALGGDSYPTPGRKASLHPAAEVFVRGSTAVGGAGYKWSGVITSFISGATIKSRDGDWLAIPTDAVPKGRNRKPITPAEAAQRFGELRPVKSKRNGRNVVLLFADAVQGKRGLRKATARRTAAGRQVEGVLLYVLVPTVKRPALLPKPDAVVAKWRDRIPALVAAEFSK